MDKLSDYKSNGLESDWSRTASIALRKANDLLNDLEEGESAPSGIEIYGIHMTYGIDKKYVISSASSVNNFK